MDGMTHSDCDDERYASPQGGSTDGIICADSASTYSEAACPIPTRSIPLPHPSSTHAAGPAATDLALPSDLPNGILSSEKANSSGGNGESSSSMNNTNNNTCSSKNDSTGQITSSALSNMSPTLIQTSSGGLKADLSASHRDEAASQAAELPDKRRVSEAPVKGLGEDASHLRRSPGNDDGGANTTPEETRVDQSNEESLSTPVMLASTSSAPQKGVDARGGGSHSDAANAQGNTSRVVSISNNNNNNNNNSNINNNSNAIVSMNPGNPSGLSNPSTATVLNVVQGNMSFTPSMNKSVASNANPPSANNSAIAVSHTPPLPIASSMPL
eukprot:CAMPEP_0175070080 /NCGR_PEP_ID=MMETSP0052_2-20121109/18526_1 /TAXON_ID=51329 ORGANISM="Polytomella parva, Strain SAG 63-3" /NCGR_SAMPLE_ID=MMETSP0052_2 /ASSEMBLY_ACC=CAM_ASM_000194 /LENGTH=327 /DNA_ID=CAMNT_0016337175 /DNA_START=102 /DNA_END=1081 /DNA_ORIENTATION=+